MGENISTRVAYGRALAEFGDRSDIYVFDLVGDIKFCCSIRLNVKVKNPTARQCTSCKQHWETPNWHP